MNKSVQQRRGLKRELSLRPIVEKEEEEVVLPGFITTNTRMTTSTSNRRMVSSSSWLVLALICLVSCIPRVLSSDDAYNNNNNYNYNGDDQFSNDQYQIDDGNLYYNNGNGNNNYKYYNNYANNNNNNYNGNDNNNGNYNGNYNNANNDNNDDGNNANNNNNGGDDLIDYDYTEATFDDEYIKAWQDDNIDLNVEGFDAISISPSSCLTYNSGHMIKFDMYETENSYQCHRKQIGTFVVSIAHFMHAYFNYQALTQGSYFKLPEDVGYLNCIPLKMEAYGYGDDDNSNANDDAAANDDANAQDEQKEDEEDENQQPILYAKVGCLPKKTYSSNAFQLHVYTDNKCTEPYEDGQTSQEHASKGYMIDPNEYYGIQQNDQATSGYAAPIMFSSKVTFRPNFYSCQSCKPKQISGAFNRYAGNFYDDNFIVQYGMTRSAYKEYVAEQQAAAAEAAECNNCQYFHYSTDDAVDDYNKGDVTTTNYGGSSIRSSSSSGGDDSVQAVDDAYYNVVTDDYSFMANSNYFNWGNRNLRRLGQHQDEEPMVGLFPIQSEFKKFESEFWDGIDDQLEGRSLYENKYGGVDDWNMCDQVYRYGLYCDEQCQALDTFRPDQWSSADLILLGIMCAFMAAMVALVVGKRNKTARVAERQKSFFAANSYDTSSGIDVSQIPGLPPKAMYIMLAAIMTIVATLAILKFVNETLVFAVVCCILLFIYMLKITLFGVNKRPVLLASPNHEDVFGYNAADDHDRSKGFFS